MDSTHFHLQKLLYKPKLTVMMKQCTLNFLVLDRILPPPTELEENHHLSFLLARGVMRRVQFSLIKKCPYTSFWKIEESAVESGNPQSSGADQDFLPLLQIQVRLYHDAKLAEVIEAQRFGPFKPVYEYPNPNLFAPNEKSQWNAFLSEWLEHCRSFGLAEFDFATISGAIDTP